MPLTSKLVLKKRGRQKGHETTRMRNSKTGTRSLLLVNLII
ncbi:unnamed protein product [Haemonchus placei]|uniref:50S ribosomal protein L34 n=1 Tax=Haemonchus placei TaxID=6290 RepID=A0A0N4VVQ1_HAEPC|nr:unnamed protein product [Haemonchus placei]